MVSFRACVSNQQVFRSLGFLKVIFPNQITICNSALNNSIEIDNYLKLDCSKAKAELEWEQKWNINKSLESIVEWNKVYLSKQDLRKITEKQIEEYFS